MGGGGEICCGEGPAGAPEQSRGVWSPGEPVSAVFLGEQRGEAMADTGPSGIGSHDVWAAGSSRGLVLFIPVRDRFTQSWRWWAQLRLSPDGEASGVGLRPHRGLDNGRSQVRPRFPSLSLLLSSSPLGIRHRTTG